MSALSHGLTPDPRQHPYRAEPDPATGALVVDPSIRLRAKSFGVDLSLYYSTNSTDTSPWGYGRSCSVHGRILGDSSVPWVVVERGDFERFTFNKEGTSGNITTYTRASVRGNTTLSYDSTSQEFTEYFIDGTRLVYKRQRSSGDVQELVRVVDTAGYIHTYSYGSAHHEGLLQSIQTPGDRRVTLNYIPGPTTSLVNSVVDWSGRRWTMMYDTNACLTTYTTPLGCTTKYGYADFSGNTLLEVIEDPRGYRTSYTYNAEKRVTAMKPGPATYTYTYAFNRTVITQPNGALVTLNYGADHRVESRQDPSGSLTTYAYDSQFNPIAVMNPLGYTTTATYNFANQLVMSQDALGRRTTLAYDSLSRLTTITDAAGGVSEIIYNGSGQVSARKDPLGRLTTNLYNAGLLETVIDPAGYRVTYLRDSWGNVEVEVNQLGGRTTMSYDSLNRMTTRQGPDGAVWSYTYDAGDNLVATEDPLGYRTTTIYDGCLPIASVNALGNRTTTTYGRFENVLTVQTPLGFVTTMHYNNMGDQLSTEDPLGYRTTSIYDSSRRVEASEDQLGYRTTYIRDAAGQVTGVLNARGYRTTSVYDAVGNVSASIDALGYRTTNTYDNLNRSTATQNARGYTWTTVYDAASQVTASIDPLGYRTTNTYTAGGLPATVTDPLGRVTTTTYEAAAPLVRTVTSPMGFVSTYGYDTSMRNTSKTAPGGGVTTTVYDTRGLMSQMVNPLGHRTSYGYDAAMQPVTMMNALGQVRTSTYDADGRLEAHRYQAMPPVTYSYDARSQVILVQDQMGLTTSQYDPRGALTNTTSAAGMTTLAYDQVGSRNLEVLPGGQRFTYAYDAAQQMTTLSYGASAHALAYNPVGDVTTETYGNGSVLTRTFDPRGNLATWVSSHGVPGGITIGFTYDAAGRKTVRTDAGVPTTYSYDNDDRLTGQLVAGRAATYAYDADRNLTLKWHQGQNPVTMTNNVFGQVTTSIQGTAVTTYSWDAAGRNTLIDEPMAQTTRTWDEENRLVTEARGDADIWDFVYGHDNLRGRTIFNSVTDRQFLWVDGELLMQFGPTYTNREPLLRAGGVMVGSLSQAYYGDDLGHIVQWLKSGGDTENVTYWPYGETASGDQPEGRFGYMGSYFVSTAPFSKLLYAQQRWLATDIGRFPSVDPLWPSELAYMYVDGMPVMAVDPAGLGPGADFQRCFNRLWGRSGIRVSPRDICIYCKRFTRAGVDCNSARFDYENCWRFELPSTKQTTDTRTGPPPVIKPPLIIGSLDKPEWPYGSFMDPGSALCTYECLREIAGLSKSERILSVWCKALCTKIRQGGCTMLLDYCLTLTGSGQEQPAKACMTFYHGVC